MQPIDVPKPTLTNISETDFGRTVHAVLAWSDAIVLRGGKFPRSYAEYSLEQRIFLFHHYERHVIVAASGSYGDAWTEGSEIGGGLAVFAGLAGTPFKGYGILSDTRSIVAILGANNRIKDSRIGWCMTIIDGGHNLTVFYDPQSREIWRWGDRGPRTQYWVVPTLDEVLNDPELREVDES